MLPGIVPFHKAYKEENDTPRSSKKSSCDRFSFLRGRPVLKRTSLHFTASKLVFVLKRDFFSFADLDKLDNEKRELIQNDISALHHFYSKHIEYPDNAALVVLFGQVRWILKRG